MGGGGGWVGVKSGSYFKLKLNNINRTFSLYLFALFDMDDNVYRNGRRAFLGIHSVAGARNLIAIPETLLREESQTKNVSKSGKSPKGRIRAYNQKVQSSKFGLFDKMGGGLDFQVFPNVNADFKCFS